MQPSGQNLLLINPWIYDFTAYDLWSKPLGLLYIASFLKQQGFKVSYIDCLGSKVKTRRYGTGHFQRTIVDKPEILRSIPRHYARYGMSELAFRQAVLSLPKPEAVLITSIMTYWYQGPQHVVQIIRELLPGIPVILGGIYASLLPAHAKLVVKPDYILTGPGELKILDLLVNIFDLDKNQFRIPKSLDDYPYPAFELSPDLDYLTIITARGCPYNCSFCAQKKISMRFTQRNPDEVVKEIVIHFQKYQIRDFAFYDDALFINHDKHIKHILKKLIDTNLPLRLHSPNGLFTRYLDEELAELMYRANFKTIRLSFETANESRRQDMYNKISNKGMIDAIKYLTSAGYNPKDIEAYVIMGLPGQDIDEVIESIVFVNNLGVQVRLASYSPIPGTMDFDRAVQAELIKPDIDPLLTNKTIFPLNLSSEGYEAYRKIRKFSQLMNQAADRELRIFTDPAFKRVLNTSLKD